MNFGGGAGVDLGGLSPLTDLVHDLGDMQFGTGVGAGIGLQQETGAAVAGQGVDFLNMGGGLAGAE